MKDFIECERIICYRVQGHSGQEGISYGKLFFPKRALSGAINLYAEDEKTPPLKLIFMGHWILHLSPGSKIAKKKRTFISLLY